MSSGAFSRQLGLVLWLRPAVRAGAGDQTWTQTCKGSGALLTCWVTLDRWLCLFWVSFPHLQTGDDGNDTFLINTCCEAGRKVQDRAMQGLQAGCVPLEIRFLALPGDLELEEV